MRETKHHTTTKIWGVVIAGGILLGSALVYTVFRGNDREEAQDRIEAVEENPREVGNNPGQADGSIDTSSCKPGGGRGACIARLLGDLATRDPQRALVEYTAAVGDDPEALQQCHGAHHILGEAAGTAFEISDLLQANPGTCGLGFIHGAIASYLGKIDKNQTAAEGISVCNTIGAEAQDESLYNNCQHALGHRIAINGAAFETMLDVCKNENPIGYESCLSGGYMEFFSRDENPGMHEVWADLCNTTKDFAARACWVALFARFSATIETTSPEEVAALCETASAAETCAKGAGEAYGLLSVDKGDGVVANLVKSCAPMGEHTGTCLAGGAVIIYGAGVQKVLSLEEIKASLEREIPAQHREAVERAIAGTIFLPGGSELPDNFGNS